MDRKGVWLVFATAVISGFSIFLNKFGVAGFDPAFFATAKNLVVALLLVGTLLAMKEWPALKALSQKQWGRLAVIGLVGGSAPFLLFFTGLKLSTAAQGAAIHKTLFVWAGLLAFLFLKEKVSWNMVLGGALLIAGNLVLLRVTGLSFGLGEALILGATLLWAAEITISKHALRDLPGRVVAFGRMGLGSLFLVAYLAVTGKVGLAATVTGAGFWWILLTGALLYGYVFTFYEGLKRVPASTATAVLLLGSVITTLLDFVWNGNITAAQILGSALLLAGAVSFVGIRTLLPSPRPASR